MYQKYFTIHLKLRHDIVSCDEIIKRIIVCLFVGKLSLKFV